MEVKRSALPDSEEAKRNASLKPADPSPPLVNFLEYFSLILKLFKYGSLNPFLANPLRGSLSPHRLEFSSGLRTSEICNYEPKTHFGVWRFELLGFRALQRQRIDDEI